MGFRIGNIEIKSKVILAPMAGITSFSYRRFMSSFLNTLTYTEMISDSGLIYDNRETNSLIYTDGNEYPLALQLFGSDKEKMLKAIDILEEKNIKYDILDLNIACPVNKVIKTGAGSALLKDQEYLYNLVSSIVNKSKKPVSCKVRLGFDDANIEETVLTLQKAGVQFITIHARTKKELYSGLPHFEQLKNIKNILKIPFGVSGNIYSVEDAKNALEITGADCVLLARGGIGNPKLYINIENFFNNEEYDENLYYDEQKDFLLKFANMLIIEKGEKRAISLLKGIAPKFFVNMPNSKELRIMLSQKMNSYNDLVNILSNKIN